MARTMGSRLYSTRISGPREKQELVVQHVRDRALLFVDGACHGVLERGDRESSILLQVPPVRGRNQHSGGRYGANQLWPLYDGV